MVHRTPWEGRAAPAAEPVFRTGASPEAPRASPDRHYDRSVAVCGFKPGGRFGLTNDGGSAEEWGLISRAGRLGAPSLFLFSRGVL